MLVTKVKLHKQRVRNEYKHVVKLETYRNILKLK